MSTPAKDAGWKWPALSRKAHYFVYGISLCRRWAFTGEPCRTQGMGGGPDDCKPCSRKLAKHRTEVRS